MLKRRKLRLIIKDINDLDEQHLHDLKDAIKHKLNEIERDKIKKFKSKIDQETSLIKEKWFNSVYDIIKNEENFQQKWKNDNKDFNKKWINYLEIYYIKEMKEDDRWYETTTKVSVQDYFSCSSSNCFLMDNKEYLHDEQTIYKSRFDDYFLCDADESKRDELKFEKKVYNKHIEKNIIKEFINFVNKKIINYKGINY